MTDIMRNFVFSSVIFWNLICAKRIIIEFCFVRFVEFNILLLTIKANNDIILTNN